MTNRIHDAFDIIHTDKDLKEHTIQFLQEQAEKKQQQGRHFLVPVSAVLVSFLLIVGIRGYTWIQAPISYISIDINPSVELELNRLDRVISATAYNEDGTKLLDGQNLKGKDYREAIRQLVGSNSMDAYPSGGLLLVFTVAAGQQEKQQELLVSLEEEGLLPEYQISYAAADITTASEAHCHGMSIGKYHAYLELHQYDPTINVEECHGMTMQEISEQILAHESGHHEETEEPEASEDYAPSPAEEAAPSHGHGGHHGHGSSHE